MLPNDSNDFDVLLFLVQRFIVLLVSSGICARIGHGTLSFDFRITDGKITYSEPSIKIGVKPSN